MNPELLITLCGYFAREAETVRASEGWDDVQVATLPLDCHPANAWDALARAIHADHLASSEIHLFGGCCVSGPSAPPKEMGNCHLHKTNTCFDLFASKELVDDLLHQGVHLLTPGWLTQWREYFSRSGFDRSMAHDFFVESTSRFVLLDTGVDSQARERLREFTEFVGLPGEVVPVGLDTFRLRLIRIKLEWQLRSQQESLRQANAQKGDYAMAMDLIGALALINTERQVIENILELFTLLCAPESVVYLSLKNGAAGELYSRPTRQIGADEIAQLRLDLAPDGSGVECTGGFLLRIGESDDLLGILQVQHVAFPQYARHYLNLGLMIARVCALAIRNARTYEQLEQALADRRIAEADLRKTKDELEIRNRELEAFSYSVSHDLRTPLASIDGFTHVLQQAYASQLPEEARRYLELIRVGAQQMDELVQSLLTLSRLSRQRIKKETVEMRALVQEALRVLQKETARPDLTIEVGELPEFPADPVLLKQVWVNLIANALKFTRGREGARLEIGCGPCDGEARVYYVRDNGVGFDMDHAERLFGVFQRLHSPEEYEGTGIGLAIVQRIIQRHGGRVWAEGEIGKGATFYFTLVSPQD